MEGGEFEGIVLIMFAVSWVLRLIDVICTVLGEDWDVIGSWRLHVRVYTRMVSCVYRMCHKVGASTTNRRTKRAPSSRHKSVTEWFGIFESPSLLSLNLTGRVSTTGSDAHAFRRNPIVVVDIPLGNDGGYASQNGGSIPDVLRVWAVFHSRRPFANQLGFHCHR